jgi:hypothetical protein
MESLLSVRVWENDILSQYILWPAMWSLQQQCYFLQYITHDDIITVLFDASKSNEHCDSTELLVQI